MFILLFLYHLHYYNDEFHKHVTRTFGSTTVNISIMYLFQMTQWLSATILIFIMKLAALHDKNHTICYSKYIYLAYSKPKHYQQPKHFQCSYLKCHSNTLHKNDFSFLNFAFTTITTSNMYLVSSNQSLSAIVEFFKQSQPIYKQKEEMVKFAFKAMVVFFSYTKYHQIRWLHQSNGKNYPQHNQQQHENIWSVNTQPYLTICTIALGCITSIVILK